MPGRHESRLALGGRGRRLSHVVVAAPVPTMPPCRSCRHNGCLRTSPERSTPGPFSYHMPKHAVVAARRDRDGSVGDPQLGGGEG